MSSFNLRWPIPFPGIPVDILQPFLGILRKWRDEKLLEELDARTVTANQVLFGVSSAADTPRTGFIARILGLNPSPMYRLDFDIRGGIKAAHVHLDGKIYFLNSAQWAEFSGKVIEDFQVRLDKAKSVSLSVDQLIGIGEAANTLTR